MKSYTMKQLTNMSTPELVKIVHDLEWERHEYTEKTLQMADGFPIKLYENHGMKSTSIGSYSCYEEAIIAAISFLKSHKKYGFIF